MELTLGEIASQLGATLDGDPANDLEGVGWVQVGDRGRLGKNHLEAHGGDTHHERWGAHGRHHWKGPWIWCVMPDTPERRRARARLESLERACQPLQERILAVRAAHLDAAIAVPFDESMSLEKLISIRDGQLIPALERVLQGGEGAGKDMLRYEYHVNRERLTCDEHERHAQEWGGHVVSIESMEELQHVQSLHEGGIMFGTVHIQLQTLPFTVNINPTKHSTRCIYRIPKQFTQFSTVMYTDGTRKIFY